MAYQTTAVDSRQGRGFPSQIKYIVGNEAAERFSFYGMKSILVVFMTHYLMVSEPEAHSTYHFFVGSIYFLTLFGAYISDRFWGKYRTIMTLSLVYCVGHAVLAIWETKEGLYAGLALIAIGSGGIKPCVGAHVGDQFTSKNSHLIEKVYEIFYWSVNFGSFFSTLLIPILLKSHGPSIAFGIPGVLMAVATLVFWMGRKKYVHVPPSGKEGSSQFWSIFFSALINFRKRVAGRGFLSSVENRFPAEKIEGAKAALGVFKVLVAVSFFWALYDQHGSTWITQAEKMSPSFLGFRWEASQIQAFNPLLVMVLVPLFSLVIYPAAQKMGLNWTPLRRITIGMALGALSFFVAGFLEHLLEKGAVLSMGWQSVQYVLVTIAEIMVNITGLEFAYTQAPRAMKSTIMSLWLLTTTVGNWFTAIVELINPFNEGSTNFYFYAIFMVVVTFLFARMARGYQMKRYVESEAV